MQNWIPYKQSIKYDIPLLLRTIQSEKYNTMKVFISSLYPNDSVVSCSKHNVCAKNTTDWATQTNCATLDSQGCFLYEAKRDQYATGTSKMPSCLL